MEDALQVMPKLLHASWQDQPKLAPTQPPVACVRLVTAPVCVCDSPLGRASVPAARKSVAITSMLCCLSWVQLAFELLMALTEYGHRWRCDNRSARI
jgi:hypothetical protein